MTSRNSIESRNGKTHRRHRTSFDFGYNPFNERRTPLKDRLHRRSFSEKRNYRVSKDDDDGSYAAVVKRRRVNPHPLLDGYQLVGDSLLLRFAEQVLFERCIYENGMRYLGLCVSGQTIEELSNRVRTKFSPVGEKVILLIGTNNLLQDTDIEDMKTSLVILIDLLKQTANKIILLTLPPIPKLEQSGSFWYRYNHYNGFLQSLSEEYTIVTVVNISSLFLDDENNCNMDYFERWYDRMQRRPDLIHLNRAGLLRIKTHLYKNKILEEADQ